VLVNNLTKETLFAGALGCGRSTCRQWNIAGAQKYYKGLHPLSKAGHQTF